MYFKIDESRYSSTSTSRLFYLTDGDFHTSISFKIFFTPFSELFISSSFMGGDL